ncbi:MULTISPECIES: GNAT family N-acetyltransferase [unclassified Sphingobium]|uniref:GNAT family N-acetyltransferase n=1 Tax=unclassified Sphingobium TaxID=2611147 RepID=UPI000D1657A4|nr:MULTISPECIES: GNAT family N-acetyltransferase [unclassified Sphingobium]MBG6120036.1 GNAT superfamily N-acetyltransferase [Sphingobium sp. JAI105]PSO12908.1 GNAT family N-acetyltransferase [Sphingobium sp. AEW4]TWD05763.1 acetyltransferase (GNAT) family protein [Sphingobium sp. AEW010]TWD23316.1 acetyltransferase (GNAT) family protein [Sphingobium sp. AEW013]TWD25176.1 acetyltransferase (GNAT) family protein [Sphingobium sp. AEW001]
MRDVRDAEDADRDMLAGMFSRAFADDPCMTWLYPERNARSVSAVNSFRFLFDQNVTGIRLTTTGCEATSLWQFFAHGDRPAQTEKTPADISRTAALTHALAMHKPLGEFWYLHVTACEPAHQGAGWGAAVIRAGLARTARKSIYLETANIANLPFYRAMGFHVSEEWDVADGGPHFWSMTRPAT